MLVDGPRGLGVNCLYYRPLRVLLPVFYKVFTPNLNVSMGVVNAYLEYVFVRHSRFNSIKFRETLFIRNG